MEKYKFVLREVGTDKGMMGVEELSAYLSENVAKGGYELFHTDSSDITQDGVFVGKRVFMVFVKKA